MSQKRNTKLIDKTVTPSSGCFFFYSRSGDFRRDGPNYIPDGRKSGSCYYQSYQQSNHQSELHYIELNCSMENFTALHCIALHLNHQIHWTTELHYIVIYQAAWICIEILCTALHNNVCSAVHCSTVQCIAVQCCSVQFSAVQRSAVQFSALQCTATKCNSLQRAVLHCTVLNYNKLGA